jgi:hypothetical protein
MSGWMHRSGIGSGLYMRVTKDNIVKHSNNYNSAASDNTADYDPGWKWFHFTFYCKESGAYDIEYVTTESLHLPTLVVWHPKLEERSVATDWD